MKVCLIVGISSDDLYWSVVTPELFETIRKEVNVARAEKTRNRTPIIYIDDKLRPGVVEQFFTQAGTTADTEKDTLSGMEVQEILTYMA